MSDTREPSIPFGKKYKGVPVSQVPDDYLGWLYEKATLTAPWLIAAVANEVSSRGLSLQPGPSFTAEQFA